MLKKVITIEGQNSSEAKPVAMLVQVASQYESTIYLETGSKRVNAKSKAWISWWKRTATTRRPLYLKLKSI